MTGRIKEWVAFVRPSTFWFPGDNFIELGPSNLVSHFLTPRALASFDMCDFDLFFKFIRVIDLLFISAQLLKRIKLESSNLSSAVLTRVLTAEGAVAPGPQTK